MNVTGGDAIVHNTQTADIIFGVSFAGLTVFWCGAVYVLQVLSRRTAPDALSSIAIVPTTAPVSYGSDSFAGN